MLRVEEVVRADQLPAFRAAWKELSSRADHSEPFTTSEWLESWLAAFWADKPIAFQFVWEGDRLEGLMPLLRDRDGDLWCRDSLVTPGNPHMTRLSVLSAGHPGPILEAAVQNLRRTHPTFRLGVKHLALDDPSTKSLLRLATRHELGCTVRDAHESYYIDFDHEQGWTSYERGISPHTRREMHRKERIIARAGAVSFSLVTEPEDVDGAMSTVLEIDAASWKEQAGTSMTREAHSAAFYLDLARRCARNGTLRVYFLLLDDRPIAYQYAIVHGPAFYALKTSYRVDVKHLSAGTVLTAHVLKDTYDQGYRVLDFLGTAERWKRHLTNRSHRHVNVCVFSPHQPRCAWCHALEHDIKPMVRNYAPTLVAWKRRLSEGPLTRPRRHGPKGDC